MRSPSRGLSFAVLSLPRRCEWLRSLFKVALICVQCMGLQFLGLFLFALPVSNSFSRLSPVFLAMCTKCLTHISLYAILEISF